MPSIFEKCINLIKDNRLWASFVLLHFCFAVAYVVVFQITRTQSFAESFVGALTNVVPLFVLNLLVIGFLDKFVLHRGLWGHVLVHPFLASAFSFAWYFCVIVGRGFESSWLEDGFVIRPFGWVGGTWQLYQGLAVYGIAATFAYAVHFYRRAIKAESELSDIEPDQVTSSSIVKPLIIRSDGEYKSYDWRDIVFIEANGDEVLIHTGNSQTSTHKTMTSIARLMPSPPLIRVHRSYIINLENVVSAEPAGNGRLTLHMGNGFSLTTSRSGAQTFRTNVD